MNPKKYFEKYHTRLQFEAVLKSLLSGLIIGLGAAFLVAFINWFNANDVLVLAIGLLVGLTAIASTLFYIKIFRPTAMSNARRIDRLGLEERLITMVEYDGDDSYMATAQRNDAKAELAKFEASQIKFKVPKAVLIAVAVCAVLGLGMTTVTTLSVANILPSGFEVLDAILPDPPKTYYSVTYVAEKGGRIEGKDTQRILKGESADTVIAVADDGFMFKGWSDGSKDPARIDEDVMTELIFNAIFIPVDGSEGDEGDPEEEADDVPDPESQKGDGDGDGDPSSGASGKYEDYNQIIDGTKYYREFLEGYQDTIDEQIKNDDSGLTEEQKEVIKNYIDIV